MPALKAHFDGQNLVPDEPVHLPKDKPLLVQVEVLSSTDKPRQLGLRQGQITVAGDFDNPLPNSFWLGEK